MPSLLRALLVALSITLLTGPAMALCKPVIGIRVYRDDWAYTIPCGRNDCNAPETTITVFHEDRTTTRQAFPGSISFGYSNSPQAQLYEWDFFGKMADDPGYGFRVYATRCPALPRNQGLGCLERALRISRGYLPKATWAQFDCGETW